MKILFCLQLLSTVLWTLNVCFFSRLFNVFRKVWSPTHSVAYKINLSLDSVFWGGRFHGQQNRCVCTIEPSLVFSGV